MRATLLLSLVLLTSPAAAEDGFFPEVFLHLKGAHYFPSDAQMRWTGWIGAGAGLARFRGTTFYVRADVETILGNEHFHFEANQANYPLEGGVHRRLGAGDLSLYMGHVSRHLEDRAKTPKVDWNVLGVRFAARLPERWPVPAWAELSVAKTTLTSSIDYRWEFTGRLDLDLVPARRVGAYLLSEARVVTTDPAGEGAFDRHGFADVVIEGGLRLRRAGRYVEGFVAYEHRNDVFLLEPASRDRALVGVRIRALHGTQEADKDPALYGPWRTR